jgi:hypothetical protein
MVKFYQLFLSLTVILPVNLLQAGVTYYLGAPEVSVSPKGDRVAKSYYWSGKLQICDHDNKILREFLPTRPSVLATGQSHAFAWSQCKNEIVIFSKGSLVVPANFEIYDLEYMRSVHRESFSVPVERWEMAQDGVLRLFFEDSSESHFNLNNYQWVYHCDLGKRRHERDKNYSVEELLTAIGEVTGLARN